MALFGEKYGDSVRVVSFGDFSKELCGGTHVAATGQIGMFRILSESSVSSGVRRIEAVCGEQALRQWRETDKFVHDVANRLKTSIAELPARVEKVLAREKELEKKIEKLMQGGGGEDLLSKVKTVAGVKLLAAEVPEADEAQLKLLGDQYKQKLGSGVLVLGSRGEGKATLVVMVSSDLAAKAPAGKLVAALAPKVGGRGGGKPEMAQAGGKEPAGLDAALAEAEAALLSLLG
jgi:alanyl-tRNA synthetase